MKTIQKREKGRKKKQRILQGRQWSLNMGLLQKAQNLLDMEIGKLKENVSIFETLIIYII